MYLCLSGEDAWVDLPTRLQVIDDLSNICQGYSFPEEPPFQNKRFTFFLSLVERGGLGTCMVDGTWAWDHVAIKDFVNSAGWPWGHVIHALYISVHLSTCPTQFLQHQIRNVNHPCNIFFQGEEEFFFMRYQIHVFCVTIHVSRLNLSHLRYLCITNGKQTNPEEFCRDLPKRNYEAFSCMGCKRLPTRDDYARAPVYLPKQVLCLHQRSTCWGC
ncbi:hypothetical protein JVT61DRAFT_14918 [Boletus reticuloceps]|uniref:Uncharacterized protein n=1 Tax=Boletus reticuloceps TaxID=495285 RepID=A0A8I2YCJ9_9AGAM|nr:hypothetical protein JVT61DRAFT_14918 [Boletus reticuloceps]